MFTQRENCCRRFQANIFNKRKCQNCFRTLESHTFIESDLQATTPVKAGWLLLAPEGIDFLNRAHKNRKWQRRYFTLYENGLLHFALDEMPGTLAQGTVNMSQCSDILDASSQTSFRNSLCLRCSDRDYYIRTEISDHITGWQENLLVHSNAAKTICKKRRREPSLSLHNLKKHTLPERNHGSDDGTNILNTSWSSGNRSATQKKSPENRIGSDHSMSIDKSVKHEGLNTRTGAEGVSVGRCNSKDTSGAILVGVEVAFTHPSFPGAELLGEPEWIVERGDQSSSRMSDADASSISLISSYLFSNLTELPNHISTNAPKSREGVESGYSSLEKTRFDPEDAQTSPDQDYRRSQVLSQFEQENGMHISARELHSSSASAAECDQAERANHSMTLQAFACGQRASVGSPSNRRRSKSLERNLAEHTPTPDLLHYKKGWMMKLGEDGKWRKHWFVLTNQSLRFYRDSAAEEAADLDGEINLSACFDITDFPVQRNYGFQIQTKDGVFTLCAMTSGIRRNWIEALMKNISTSLARDVMCALPQTVPMGMVSECKSAFASDPPISDEERSSIVERRREWHYKTFDWAEFSHMKKKRETLGRQSGVESEFLQEDSVPPAPAQSPEELVASTVMLTHTEMAQDPYLKSADPSLLMGSSILTGKPADQKSAVVDGVDVYNDLSNELKEKKKETDLHPLPSPATFSSLSVQTECQWDLELQTLCAELKTTNKRTKKEVREYKLSEARLKAKLNDRQECLRETESTLRKTVATLRKRENALKELQSCFSEVSGRLKATEEAQALKDVRLRKHLCLLEESQERERKSLSDSLEHAEKRGKELEERLMQTETVLQKMPTGSMVEQWERKCQELQNQLAESDSELSRLQARLQNEETLYYDMEHNYAQVCEELELVRGTLENCERICEERFRIQLEQQQEKLNRKEQELQEAFLKIGCSGATPGKSGIFQPHVFNLHPMESQMNGDKLGNFGFSYLGKQPVAQGDKTEQVISVIQALESKLCDTEERHQEITKDERNRKHCGIILEKTNGKDNLATSEMFDFDLQEALQDKSTSPDKLLSQRMTNRMLSLEALVIQRMASVLDHPTIHFLDGLSDLQSQTKALREAYDGRHEGPVTKNYSQLFSYYQEMGEEGCSLNECEIYSLCMKAELTYLTYTDHLHNPEVEHGSQDFNVPLYLGSEVKLPHTLEETNSKSGFWLSDVSLPELVPCKKRLQGEKLGYSLEDLDKDSLIVELQMQARSLQVLSKQLYPLDENAISLSEFSPIILRTVLFQAIMAYVTCKLHVAMQRQVHLLQDQRKQAACQCRRLEAMLQEQTERYEEKLREDRVVIEVAELARVSAETDVQIKGQELQHLEEEFKKKLQEHQQIHIEILRLHEYYMQNQSQTLTPTESNNGELSELSVTTMKERIHDLKLHIRSLEDECCRGDANTLRQAYEQELETLKVTCELGFSSMEQSHQRVIEEMQRQHQIEMEQLLEEKDRVLQEETNATIAAIEAMHKAHREELEKTRKVQQNGASTDINILHAQFKDELDSLNRELEVLSGQYSQKCLENAHLSRTLETERQAMTSVERENQELHTRNQELNKRLVAELSLMQSCVHKEVAQAELSQSKDMIQLEVAIRVKESEIQCLKQEISSLKEELQAVYRHCKKLLNDSSVSGVRCPTSFIKHKADTCRQQSPSYDVVKSRSNPDLMKNCTKPNQPIRSKSLREHLSVQERMKLFESGIK